MRYNHYLPVISLCSGLVVTLLSGCQTNSYHPYRNTPVPLVSETIFDGEPLAIESEHDIFALPTDAVKTVRKIVANSPSTALRTKNILRFILSYADNGLLYDNSNTRTASETLLYGKANCLSLSILTYSLAQEVGIDATFQDVLIPEYFTSEFNQTWLNGHVNLRLKRSPNKTVTTINFANDIIVDFDPYSLKQQFPVMQISANRIVAMFYNNKAAVYYAENNMVQAYRYFKAAAIIDPKFAVTWSNLGILYRHHGLLAEAEAAYLHSLGLAQNSINTKANLAHLYRIKGDATKATILETQVHNQRKNNPYFYIMLGAEALLKNSYSTAVKHYKKAITLDRTNHEAYFGLAKSYYLLGKPLQAAIEMEKAQQFAPAAQDKLRYQSKLALLNQIARRH